MGRAAVRHRQRGPRRPRGADPPRRPLSQRDLPAEPDDAALTAELAALAGVPLDLAAGDSLRARLLSVGGKAVALLIAVHHMVFDGVSAAVLARTLSAALRRQPVRPATRTGFDALAEAAEMDPDLLEESARRLATTDSAAPRQLGGAAGPGGCLDLVLPGVDAAARTRRSTPFCLVLAAWLAAMRDEGLLGAASGVRLSLVADDRASADTETAGYLVRTIPLVVPATPVRVDAVTAAVAGALSGRPPSLAQLAPSLRRLGVDPAEFGTIMATYEDWVDPPGLRRIAVPPRRPVVPKCPLSLSCVREGSGTTLRVVHAPDRYAPHVVAALAARTRTRIAQLAS